LCEWFILATAGDGAVLWLKTVVHDALYCFKWQTLR